MRPWAIRPATSAAAALLMATSVIACGGGTAGGGGAAGSGSSSAGVSDTKAQAITEADIMVFRSVNATGYVVGHPQNVRHAELLLRPLIVAKTLQVNPSNAAAGGLVSSLLGQLDNTIPGLTTGSGSNERLDPVAVHRLFVYGRTKPTEVFEPAVARGISQLTGLLSGLAANERVSLAGQQPVETARALVIRDEQSVARYWPNLARRLSALAAALH
jgi:hypothetical protein